MLFARSLPVFFVGLSLAGALRADTIQVPAEAATIQAAADLAAEGDVVLIAKGTYAEAVTLSAIAGVTFRGQGKVILTPSIEEGNAPAFTLAFSADVVFESLEFEGFADAIEVTQVQRLVVRDCVFRENTIAVNLNNVSQASVRDCRVDSGSTGVQVAGGEAVVITENRFKVTATGVNVSSGEQHIVDDNKFTGGLFGIFLGGTTSQVELNDNLIRDVANIGIALAGGGHRVLGNTLKKCGTGIRSSFGAAHTLYTIADNRVLQSAVDGIFLRASESRVMRNIVKKTGGSGIAADAVNIQVVRNTVSATGGAGLRAVGNDGSFVGNKVKKSGGDAISVEGTGNFFAGNQPSTPFDL
ncbi:MAG: hypothetical protein DHS20C15_23330 [Planctomycetota bacterium]|nr:MAG: hypothetical protein DHS20C15_23330 [Planctomycetota bacterium]